eukprot:931570-Pelagomonas_calceolata.AAC.5
MHRRRRDVAPLLGGGADRGQLPIAVTDQSGFVPQPPQLASLATNAGGIGHTGYPSTQQLLEVSMRHPPTV